MGLYKVIMSLPVLMSVHICTYTYIYISVYVRIHLDICLFVYRIRVLLAHQKIWTVAQIQVASPRLTAISACCVSLRAAKYERVDCLDLPNNSPYSHRFGMTAIILGYFEGPGN